MIFLYITSNAASNIYGWRWDEHKLKSLEENFDKCVICDLSMREHFETMLSEIRIEMKKRCVSAFESEKVYYHLTTISPSYVKELKVIKDKICNTVNNKYNYFDTEQDANEALKAIVAIFRKYGIVL